MVMKCYVSEILLKDISETLIPRSFQANFYQMKIRKVSKSCILVTLSERIVLSSRLFGLHFKASLLGKKFILCVNYLFWLNDFTEIFLWNITWHYIIWASGFFVFLSPLYSYLPVFYLFFLFFFLIFHIVN